MKILIYGPSGTLGTGYGVDESERFPALFASKLNQHFPDEQIDVNVQPWRFFSPSRQQAILAEVEEFKPDYLVMEATPLWVYLTSWAAWARRRLPSQFRRHIGSIDRLDTQFRSYLRPHGWLRHTYELPVALVARWLVGREPLYSASHVVDFFASLISVAKRHESMDLIVTNHRLLSAEHAKQFPDGPRLAEELASALKTECRKHHVRLVDYSDGLQSLPQSELFLSDAIHLSIDAKRREAEMLADTIHESERVFR
jgi:hypothetical protein